MNRKFAAVAALVVAAVTLTAGAAAGPAGKQRIAIEVNARHGFVLTPLTSGAVERDTGITSACCWSRRFLMRDGQSIEINDPEMTLTGKHGSLVTRSRIEWIDLGGGYAVGTSTWRVVSGTGAYAGLAGSGRAAVVELPSGTFRSRFEGFVGVR